jgi:hypothetical protein
LKTTFGPVRLVQIQIVRVDRRVTPEPVCKLPWIIVVGYFSRIEYVWRLRTRVEEDSESEPVTITIRRVSKAAHPGACRTRRGRGGHVPIRPVDERGHKTTPVPGTRGLVDVFGPRASSNSLPADLDSQLDQRAESPDESSSHYNSCDAGMRREESGPVGCERKSRD